MTPSLAEIRFRTALAVWRDLFRDARVDRDGPLFEAADQALREARIAYDAALSKS